MKKNLLITILFIINSNIIFGDAAKDAVIIANTAEVLQAVVKTQNDEAEKRYQTAINEDFLQLKKEFDQPPISAEIKKIREKINEATKELLKLQSKKPTNNDVEKFAQNFIQPCYQELVKNSLQPLPLMQKKLHLISFNVSPTQKAKLDLQVYDILNRISLLWRVIWMISHIPNDHQITLSWPNATLSIADWILLINKIAQEEWKKVYPEEAKKAEELLKKQADEQRQTKAKDAEAKKIEYEAKKQILKDQERNQTEFEKIKPTQEKLEQFEQIFIKFEKFIATQKLTHEIFEKHQFKKMLDTSCNLLKDMVYTFANKDKKPEHELVIDIHKLQYSFAAYIDTLYSHYFKKEFAGHIGRKYLVIKHNFAPKSDGKPIPKLIESEAVALLTDMIVILEMYETLFPQSKIKVLYFNQNNSVQNWIEITAQAGFNMYEQFSEELQTSLKQCLPQPEEIKAISFSEAAKSAMSGIKSKAGVLGSTVKEKGKATGSWLGSYWKSFKEYVTRHIEEEIDEL